MVWIILLQRLKSERFLNLFGLNIEDWCLMVAVGSVFRLSLTTDHIHWAPSFMKIVGWLWFNTCFALLLPVTSYLLHLGRHYTALIPFSFCPSLPLSPGFLSRNLLFCPSAFILFFYLDNNGKEKMSLSQTYFSNFTITWNLWYPSPTPSSYQGCYDPTETFLLPPDLIHVLGYFVGSAMHIIISFIYPSLPCIHYLYCHWPSHRLPAYTWWRVYHHAPVKTMQMSINEWMEQQNMVQTYNEMLFSFKSLICLQYG